MRADRRPSGDAARPARAPRRTRLHSPAPAKEPARRLTGVKPWIAYSLVRLGLFGAALGLLLLLPIHWLWATLIATVVSMAVSYIAFAGLRDQVALDLAARRARGSVDPDAADEDAAAEDSALDGHPAPPPASTPREP